MIQAALEKLLEAENGAAIEQFANEGYTSFNNALEKDDAQSYLTDIQKCWDDDHFTPNMVEFLTASGPLQLKKPNIYECDMHQQAVRNTLPSFKALFDEDLPKLIRFLNEKFPFLALTGGDEKDGAGVAKHLTVKLQINKGGCFPWHYDNPSPPNKRKLTLAMYLTPEYVAENGGELVLMPFLKEEKRVQPAFNTLALFRSDLVNHRVMPEKLGTTRYCYTIWFDSSNVNPDDEVNLRAKHLTEEFIPTLMASPVQRALSRAVYDAEYREALIDCFGEGTKEQILSERMHEAHLKPLMGNPAVRSFVEKLIQRKPAKQLQ